jgi:predicted nucleic acid-binding protein
MARAFRRKGQQVAASVLTKVEVLAGMRSHEEAATRRLLALFAWIPVDEATAERAGDLARTYMRSHPGIDSVDYVIAATVEALEAELWTRNVKHYPMLSRVRGPYGM